MTAVNGTHMMMKTKSATAREKMRMLVVFRMFLLAVTTTMTDRLPTKPSTAISPKIIGMMMRTTYSKTTFVPMASAVEQLDVDELLASDAQGTAASESIVAVTSPRYKRGTRTKTEGA